MAAGTVISGGFPGRVAQEVQPNPKCNGCLHFDGQGGRTGICSIGSKPWLCGDGDAADIGYAPIARGAGTYLSAMSNTGAHAPAVGDQDTSSLTGAGSTRAVQFQQVSLGEEHVHFVKSMVANHTAMQKQLCRLCKSAGTTMGMAPANVAPQVCTCEPIEARTIAKALIGQLSNHQRVALGTDEKEWLTEFVYACARGGFSPDVAKATSFFPHGKYETTPTSDGTGRQHVDFHPRGGGEKHRVGTFESRRHASEGARAHARRFASGSGADNTPPKTTHTPPGMPSMKEAVSVAKKSLKFEPHPQGGHIASTHHGDYEVQPLRGGDSHVLMHYAKDKHGKDTGTFRQIGSGFGSSHEAMAAAEKHHARVAKSDDSAEDDVEKGLSWKVRDTGQNYAKPSHGTYRIQSTGEGKFTTTYTKKDHPREKPHDWGNLGSQHGSHREARAAAEAHHAKISKGGAGDYWKQRKAREAKKPKSSGGGYGAHEHYAEHMGNGLVHVTHRPSGLQGLYHPDGRHAGGDYRNAPKHVIDEAVSRGINKSFKLNFKPHPEGGSHIAHGDHGEYEISPGPKRNGHSTHRVDYYKHGAGDHPTMTWHLGTREHAEQHANDHHMAVHNTSQNGA